MKFRFVLVSLAAIGLLVAGGCGTKGPKLVKVSGTVKFKDGNLIQVPADTGQATITFQVAETGGDAKTGEVRKGAQGKSQPDGRFELYTFKQMPPDGVIPGKYKVTLERSKLWLITLNSTRSAPRMWRICRSISSTRQSSGGGVRIVPPGGRRALDDRAGPGGEPLL